MVNEFLAKTKKGLLVAALAVCGVAAGLTTHASASLTGNVSNGGDISIITVDKYHVREQIVAAATSCKNKCGTKRYTKVYLYHYDNTTGDKTKVASRQDIVDSQATISTSRYNAINAKFSGKSVIHLNQNSNSAVAETRTATLPK